MKVNKLTPSCYLISIFFCLGLSFLGCTSSIKKNTLRLPMQLPNHPNVTYSYFDYAEDTTVCDYENEDVTYLHDYDAWQEEVYGPLIALDPFLVDNPK